MRSFFRLTPLALSLRQSCHNSQLMSICLCIDKANAHMPAHTHTHTQSPTRERENIAYISAVAIFVAFAY